MADTYVHGKSVAPGATQVEAGLPTAVKGEVPAFPEGLQYVFRMLHYGWILGVTLLADISVVDASPTPEPDGRVMSQPRAR